MMHHQDNLMYFGIRARGEATRMLYVLAGERFTDQRLGFEDWPAKKPGKPKEFRKLFDQVAFDDGLIYDVIIVKCLRTMNSI